MTNNKHVFNEENYDLYVTENSDFKESVIELVFSIPYTDYDYVYLAFLRRIMIESTQNLKKREDKIRYLEKLYNAKLSATLSRVANCLHLNIGISMINNIYSEKNLQTNALDLLMSFLNNPNIINGRFDKDYFLMVKQDIASTILKHNENPNRLAYYDFIYRLDKDCYLGKSLVNYQSLIEQVTNSKLVKYFYDFFDRASCKIFAAGDFNSDCLNEYFLTHYEFKKNPFPIIIPYNINFKNIVHYENNSDFSQSVLLAVLEEKNITEREKYCVAHLFNLIFGTGGSNNKLFTYLREQNSLCYSVNSDFYLCCNIFLIGTGIKIKDKNKTISLIKKALKDMQSGNFSGKDLDIAKKNLKFSITCSNDSILGYLSDLENVEIYHMYCDEELLSIIDSVTKEEIVAFANKLYYRGEYVLKEKSTNEEN